MTTEIPRRYSDSKYSDVPENVQKYFEEMRETRKGIYIHGGVGLGKTHIAYALYREWKDRRKNELLETDSIVTGQIKDGVVLKSPIKVRPDAKFWNMTRLLFEIRNQFRTSNSDQTIAQSLMESKKLLFIDDLGAEKVTEWVEEVVYLTVNSYYENNIPIIFTSNYPLSGIAEKVGERVASRIKEMCHIVALTGEDRRLKK